MVPSGGRADEANEDETTLVVRFRQAAVALADRGDRSHALEAASAIVALASAGAEHQLSGLLRPDPAADAVAWTVACYQIGDLTPSALRDFAEASQAVMTLAACGESAHVAAELLACTTSGLTWTPLTRTGAEVSFELFGRGGDRSESPAPSPPDPLTQAAARHWEALLEAWRLDPEAGLAPAAPVGDALPPEDERGSGTEESLERRVVVLEEQIQQLAAQVRSLEWRLSQPAPFSGRLRQAVTFSLPAASPVDPGSPDTVAG